MAANLNVVQLPTAPLTDIPAQLRQLADAIEAGDHGEVTTLFAVKPNGGDYPTVYGWGDVERHNEPIIQFELAKLWLLTHMTARA